MKITIEFSSDAGGRRWAAINDKAGKTLAAAWGETDYLAIKDLVSRMSPTFMDWLCKEEGKNHDKE
jgi:hypothetical protein